LEILVVKYDAEDLACQFYVKVGLREIMFGGGGELNESSSEQKPVLGFCQNGTEIWGFVKDG
jgi:hypothetical protein